MRAYCVVRHPKRYPYGFLGTRTHSHHLHYPRFVRVANGKRLTFRGAFNARGSLSADGKKIALVHRPSGSNYKVAIQDINTGITNILTPTSLDESPSFSPNGQMVVYATREANRGLLSIMSLDGRFRMNLPSEQGEVREPAWAPK